MNRIARFLVATLALVCATPAFVQVLAAEVEKGEETNGKLPLPRFVALGSDRINARAGPGSRYPIEWVFVRKGLPVEVVAEFEY